MAKCCSLAVADCSLLEDSEGGMKRLLIERCYFAAAGMGEGEVR